MTESETKLTTISSPEMITKPKNPANVAKGLKLAEWNRQNKKKILEGKETAVETAAESPAKTAEIRPKLLLAGTVAAAVVVGLVWFTTRIKKPSPQPPKPKMVTHQPLLSL